MTLQDRLDARKAEFERTAPASVVETMRRATHDLVASGQAGRALKTGQSAPSFALADTDSAIVRSSALIEKGPLVVTFYRGVWCPFCNLDLAALEGAAGEIRKRGATLVAISPQQPASNRKARQDHNLSFPVLSDQGGAIADAFGLRFALPADLIGVYKSFGVDLPTINGDLAWTLPMPARFVIGGDGLIAYAEVSPDYTRRPDPSELLPTIDRLMAGQQA